jgi:hypothetical protein
MGSVNSQDGSLCLEIACNCVFRLVGNVTSMSKHHTRAQAFSLWLLTAVHVRFQVNTVKLRQVFLRVLLFSSPHTPPFISYHLRHAQRVQQRQQFCREVAIIHCASGSQPQVATHIRVARGFYSIYPIYSILIFALTSVSVM